MFKLIDLIKSLGFGATIGSGLLGIVRVLNPNVFPEDVNLSWIICIGALLGAGIHQATYACIVRPVLKPGIRFIGLYLYLRQLLWLQQQGQITKGQYKDLIKTLMTSYFLDCFKEDDTS